MLCSLGSNLRQPLLLLHSLRLYSLLTLTLPQPLHGLLHPHSQPLLHSQHSLRL
jgi:hypothetical protein